MGNIWSFLAVITIIVLITRAELDTRKKYARKGRVKTNIRMPKLDKLIYINKKYKINPNLPYVLIAFNTLCPPCNALTKTHAENVQKFGNVVNYITIAPEELELVQIYMCNNPLSCKYNVAIESDDYEITNLMNTLDISEVPTAFVFNTRKILIWFGLANSPILAKILRKFKNAQDVIAQEGAGEQPVVPPVTTTSSSASTDVISAVSPVLAEVSQQK